MKDRPIHRFRAAIFRFQWWRNVSINPEWPQCVIEIEDDHSRKRQAIDECLGRDALVCKTT